MGENKDQQLLTEILTEMFARVGADYTPEFVREPGWFQRHSWSAAEEQEFKKWLIGKLRKARRVLTRRAEQEASWFLFNYGWKTKDSADGA